MTLLRWQQHLGFTLETGGWGVNATTPDLFVPIEKCDFNDDLKYYYDEAYRSVQVKDFGAYPTTANGTFNFTCDAYADTLPVLLGNGMVGDNDTVSVVNLSALNVQWVTGSVYAHTYLAQPSGPLSLSFFHFNGASERRYEGARITDATLKYSPDKQLSIDFKGDSRLSVLMNGSFVPTIGTYAPTMAWQGLLTLNNAINRRLIDCQLDFKRGSEVLFTQAQTQSPTNIYVFPIEVDGKITVDFVDEAEYNLYATGNQSASFNLMFVTSSQSAIQFFIPRPVYTSYKVNSSKDALTAELDFRAIYSPNYSTNIQLTVYNTRAAAY